MSKQRTPTPSPDESLARSVTVRPTWWSSDEPFTVTLRPCRFGDSDWEVYMSDGAWIGSVSRYAGSLDRKIAGTRLISPGKRRTLWSYQGTGKRARSMWDQVSRADCIRALVEDYRRREAPRATAEADHA